MRKLLLFLMAVLLAACASTADVAPVGPAPGTDAFNIQSTVLAVYNVISGPAGRRDWDRFEELFAPGARMMVAGDNGTTVMTTKEYIAQATPKMNAGGWFEHPVATTTQVYGNVAHVWSTYEGRAKADDAKPAVRGINSFQLVRIGGEWKVQSILWQEEDAAHPIPAAYLPR